MHKIIHKGISFILWPVHPILEEIFKNLPCGAFQDACGQQQLFWWENTDPQEEFLPVLRHKKVHLMHDDQEKKVHANF